MIRPIILSLLSCAYLAASVPSPITMASELNLTEDQKKQLQRIDATVEQVQRYSNAKRIEVLTEEQRKVFFSRNKILYENN